jgi:hypothetical protein
MAKTMTPEEQARQAEQFKEAAAALEQSGERGEVGTDQIAGGKRMRKRQRGAGDFEVGDPECFGQRRFGRPGRKKQIVGDRYDRIRDTDDLIGDRLIAGALAQTSFDGEGKRHHNHRRNVQFGGA